MKKQVPGKCSTLVYTSGTTGKPKGVMLSHDNMVWTAFALSTAMRRGFTIDENERHISFLPLSHIAGLIVDLFLHLYYEHTVYFAKPDALQGTLLETQLWAKPTLYMSVPRVFEKFEEKIKDISSQKGEFAKSIAEWAKDKGYKNVMAQQSGESAPFGYGLAHFLVLKRIKAALGFDECRFYAFSAAPLKQSTVDFFSSLDMPVYNVFGMSEGSGPLTIQDASNFCLTEAGYPVPGTVMKIDNTDEEGKGEICFRGRNIMMGYLRNEEATKLALDTDGFIHSGDQGMKTKRGFLKVTGRIKELIITAGGENIAPLVIEEACKTVCPVISNVMAIGDARKYISALITLKVVINPENSTPTNDLIPEAQTIIHNVIGKDLKTYDECVNSPEFMKYIDDCINAANKSMVSRASHIRKYKILPKDFTIAGGEMTPTLKLKRQVAYKKYIDIIEDMYAVAKL